MARLRKQGFTIIELIVGMAIFSVVMMVAVGAFISASNVKGLGTIQKESQQKLRLALEMVHKYGKQASRLKVTAPTTYTSRVYFYYNDPINSANSFSIENPENNPAKGKLYYYECKPPKLVSGVCSGGWGAGYDLLGKTIYLDLTKSKLQLKANSYAPILDVTLWGKNNLGSTKVFYQDTSFQIESSVPLEGLI